MDQPVSEHLKGLGLDVEFLAWLEGDEQRLPELERVREVKDADYAAAIRAAAWLAQYFADEKVISPQTPEQWLARYQLLERYLQAALQSTLFYHVTSTAEDLETLERVLDTLLPASFWDEYRQDFLHLRRQGIPEDIPETKAKRTGGSKESEQVADLQLGVYRESVGADANGSLLASTPHHKSSGMLSNVAFIFLRDRPIDPQLNERNPGSPLGPPATPHKNHPSANKVIGCKAASQYLSGSGRRDTDPTIPQILVCD